MMLEEQTTKLTCVADVFEVMGIPLEEEEYEEGEDVSMVMLPSIPAETPHGISSFRHKRDELMDPVPSFGGDRVHAAGASAGAAASASAAANAAAASIPMMRTGSGGLDEGDEEITDDESHSVGEDQGKCAVIGVSLRFPFTSICHSVF